MTPRGYVRHCHTKERYVIVGHEAIPYKPQEGYYQELVNFYYAVRENREIVSSPEKELGDIQTIFNVLDAIEKGKACNCSFNSIS